MLVRYQYSFIHSCIHSFIHPSIHLSIHSSYSFIHSLFVCIYPFIHSLIHSFVYSFIHYIYLFYDDTPADKRSIHHKCASFLLLPLLKFVHSYLTACTRHDVCINLIGEWPSGDGSEFPFKGLFKWQDSFWNKTFHFTAVYQIVISCFIDIWEYILLYIVRVS